MLSALLMTTLAGLSTGLGGLLVLWRAPGDRSVSLSMGFAGGVMLVVSLADLVPAGLAFYRTQFSPFGAGCAAVSLLLAGMAAAALLDGLLPDEETALRRLAAGLSGPARGESAASAAACPAMPPAEKAVQEKHAARDAAARPENAAAAPAAPAGPAALHRARALHCGLAAAAALLAHNLPEGMLTLLAGAADPRAGLRVTLAIALHNIPEGISVAAPLWYATRSRGKSAGAAFLSGLAEPAGALLACGLLRGLLTAPLASGMQLLVAGVMCWVSIAELLFGGFAMGQKNACTAGFALGAAGMLLGITVLA